jgi:hypothetical protein
VFSTNHISNRPSPIQVHKVSAVYPRISNSMFCPYFAIGMLWYCAVLLVLYCKVLRKYITPPPPPLHFELLFHRRWRFRSERPSYRTSSATRRDGQHGLDSPGCWAESVCTPPDGGHARHATCWWWHAGEACRDWRRDLRIVIDAERER